MRRSCLCSLPPPVPSPPIAVVRPHEYFSREGNDLVYTSMLSLADALTDCIIEVSAVDDDGDDNGGGGG